jgi:hypothetical protein
MLFSREETAEKHLSKASKAGIIAYRGSKKTGGYFVLSKQLK